VSEIRKSEDKFMKLSTPKQALLSGKKKKKRKLEKKMEEM